jgi:tetratricopeptide (TPR) repeat protein
LALESHKTRSLGPEGTETIEHLQVWWAQNHRIVLGVLAGAAVIVAALVFNRRTQAVQEDLAAGKLAEANVYFWQNDYARSLELAKQVYAQYGSTPSGLEAHRLAGDDAFWNGDFKGAIAEYQRYLERMKKGILADAARRSLAYALESDGQTLEAAKTFEQLVGTFDRASSAEFLMAAARCYRTLSQPAEAIGRLKRVDLEFGETSYAQAARVELGELAASATR